MFSVAGASAAKQATTDGPVLQAQILDIEKTGVPAPVGLAFAGPSETFYVLDTSVRGSGSGTEIVRLEPSRSTSASAQAGSSRIAAAVEDPINVAFDARRSRLLIVSYAGELVEIKVGAGGELAAATLGRHDVTSIGLASPQGLTVDPASGVVYVLDADGPRIVRVDPGADGSFDQAVTSEIDLRSTDVGDVRGLAFDWSTDHLQLRSRETMYELTTTGDVVATRDLAGLDLVSPQGMVIAPSGDQTDDPSATSLFVADSGGGATKASGKIVELSLAQVPTPQAIDFTSALVNMVNLGALSPPSPDPSGITYVPGSGLVFSDGEVEETVNGITHFQGANVWELTLSGAVQRTANISTVQPTVVPMTNEPTGTAFNPSNGHFYFSSDGPRRIFDLNPGADGLVGTSDDSWTSFVPNALNSDPEGITYSTFSGTLFVADGINREVFEYTTAGALVSNFDTLQHGVNDPNSVEFNAHSGTLLVLSDRTSGTGNQRLVIETTTSGMLLQTIDVGASGSFRPSGLAYAPASNGTSAQRFYVIDRVLDNNLDPNAVDGKLFELTAPAPSAPANLPPSVNAGSDASGALPGSVSLDGTVTDDGKPIPPGMVSTVWTQVSGPGTITFGNASMVDTTATASTPGVYVVRLTANDGQLSAFDEATLTFTGSGGVQTLDVSVSAGNDDAEEDTTNVVLLGNADLDLMSADESNLVVGTRFRNITIPQGASINNAYLQFTAEEAPSSGATSLTIRGQAADNPPVFAAVNTDLSTRPTTTAATMWNNVPPWMNIGDAGAAQRSPSLAGIIQELVNRPGWASGNAVVLLITGSGSRVAESFNKTSTPGGNPLLHIEYTTGNSPPQITSDGGGDTASRSIAENQTAVTTVTAVDPNAGDTVSYSISGGPDQAAFQIDSNTGVLTFVSPPNFETPTDAGANNVYDVIVAASDGSASDTQAIAVTVLNVNEVPPVITSDGGGSIVTLSRPENQTAVTTVTATDADGDPLSFSISGGDDAALFTIVASTGVLTFVTAPDFENPTDVGTNNVYEVIVAASDGSLSDTQAIAVTVTDANDFPPVITSDGGGNSAALSRPENQTAVTTVTATDADGDPITFSISGGADAARFTINSSTGVLTFVSAPDFENPTDAGANNVYDVTVAASDGNLSDTQAIAVTVTNVAEGGGGPPPPADFNADGDTDLSVFRRSNATWYVRSQFAQAFGISTDVPVPGDYDGDGDVDVAVFRPSTGTWYVRGQFTQAFGLSGDIPVPADYDGDGDSDLAVFRPSTGTWYVRSQFTQAFGLSGDVPVVGDYDGDGDSDLAVFRPANRTWYVRSQFAQAFGLTTDIPVPGDYDGDGDTDLAVWRPSSGTWYVRNQLTQAFGLTNDVPVPGNYDGDADTDLAVFRPSNATWYVRTQFTQAFGISTDIPLPLPWAIYDRYY